MPIMLLDGILVVIVLISGILAMVRGFVREVLSIAAWLAASFAALYLYDRLMPVMEKYITNKHLAIAASAATIFLFTLMLVSFLTMRLSDFVLESPVGVVDRTLGFVFGAARGFLLVAVAVMLFSYFVPTNGQPRWIADARSKPLLDSVGARLWALLPTDQEQSITQKFLQFSSPNDPNAAATRSKMAPPATPGTIDQLIESTTTQKP